MHRINWEGSRLSSSFFWFGEQLIWSSFECDRTVLIYSSKCGEEFGSAGRLFRWITFFKSQNFVRRLIKPRSNTKNENSPKKICFKLQLSAEDRLIEKNFVSANEKPTNLGKQNSIQNAIKKLGFHRVKKNSIFI